jgi:hypothetical protein
VRRDQRVLGSFCTTTPAPAATRTRSILRVLDSRSMSDHINRPSSPRRVRTARKSRGETMAAMIEISKDKSGKFRFH